MPRSIDPQHAALGAYADENWADDKHPPRNCPP